MSTSELATSYAALILADDGVEITVRLPQFTIPGGWLTEIPQAEKLQTLITAAKVPDVEPIWTTLFAKAD